MMTGFLSRLSRNRKQKAHICSAVVGGRGTASPHGGDRQDPHYAGDLPVLVHTLRVFEDCPDIAEVVVVTREDLLVEVSRLCREFDLEKVSKVVVGGKERIYSRSSLAWRRCVGTRSSSPSTMGPAPAAARGLAGGAGPGTATGAAAPAIPVTDTVKRAEGVAQETLDRSTLFCRPDPQVFQADLIRAAIHQAAAEGRCSPATAPRWSGWA